MFRVPGSPLNCKDCKRRKGCEPAAVLGHTHTWLRLGVPDIRNRRKEHCTLQVVELCGKQTLKGCRSSFAAALLFDAPSSVARLMSPGNSLYVHGEDSPLHGRHHDGRVKLAHVVVLDRLRLFLQAPLSGIQKKSTATVDTKS